METSTNSKNEQQEYIQSEGGNGTGRRHKRGKEIVNKSRNSILQLLSGYLSFLRVIYRSNFKGIHFDFNSQGDDKLEDNLKTKIIEQMMRSV